MEIEEKYITPSDLAKEQQAQSLVFWTLCQEEEY